MMYHLEKGRAFAAIGTRLIPARLWPCGESRWPYGGFVVGGNDDGNHWGTILDHFPAGAALQAP